MNKCILILSLIVFSGVFATLHQWQPNDLSNGISHSFIVRFLEKFRKHGDSDLPITDDEICSLCPSVADFVIDERRSGMMTDIQIEAEVTYLCDLLHIDSPRVCEGVIGLNVGVFMYMIDNDANITGTRACGIALDSLHCIDTEDWTIDIPKGQTVEKQKANASETFKILHISDIHYDPLYTENKTTACGEPLCCQSDQADASNETDRCGHWGSYHSGDTPWRTVLEVFNHTSTQEFDLVYFTGDIVSHRVWETSIEKNTEHISKIYDLFNEHFKVPVYFVLGNHEGNPVNIFAPEDVADEKLSTQWLFNVIVEKSFPAETEAGHITLIKDGYYTISPKAGFRLIVLNDNVCQTENWWLMYDDRDPYGQLSWMAKVLEQAEKDEEIVHVLAHVPTSSCFKKWGREFGKLVQRFANTISAQFYGHSHTDEFYVYYNQSNTSQAINVGWNGASISGDKSNPSYKLYTVDSETFQVVDIEEWTFNLTKANANTTAKPNWYQLYSFKDAYQIDDLDPASIDALAEQMAVNHTVLDQYYKFKFRNSDYALERECDESCQKKLLCKMTTTESGEEDRCNQLKEIYDENTNFSMMESPYF